VLIKDFKLEKWLNPRDPIAKYNLGASCVKALHLEEFFNLIGEDIGKFFNEDLKDISLHYGYFFGMPKLLKAISKLYRDVKPENILTTHGGTGANNMVITELVEPGDNVVSFLPNYQQHYSIPESLGAEVRYLVLKEENKYLPNIDELHKLVDKKTKMITLSNPNNPTGSFIEENLFREIVRIAKKYDVYILSDEIYRGLDNKYMISVADIYEKGIVTSSMSKVFSMAGTRVGWIIVKCKDTYDKLENRRSYDTICCGPFNELIAAKALENESKILKRSRDIVNKGRKIFDEWIKEEARLSCLDKSYTTTSLIKYDYDISEEELCIDIFEKTGVLLCHGDCFEMPKTFRLGYGFGNSKYLEEGLTALGGYFKKLK